jgi:hypothetical protein
MNDNRFYVYGHYDGNELVYVGMGQKGRAFDCRSDSTRQSNEHTKFMVEKLTNGDVSFVQFFATHLSKLEADKIELSLIKEHDPKFNLAHTKRKKVHKGEDNKKSILTEDDAFLLKYFCLPVSYTIRKSLAHTLGVNVCTVNDIQYNRTWRHI